MAKAAEEEGLILRAMGDSLGFSPPLIISEDEIDELLSRFGRAIDRVARQFGRTGLKPAA